MLVPRQTISRLLMSVDKVILEYSPSAHVAADLTSGRVTCRTARSVASLMEEAGMPGAVGGDMRRLVIDPVILEALYMPGVTAPGVETEELQHLLSNAGKALALTAPPEIWGSRETMKNLQCQDFVRTVITGADRGSTEYGAWTRASWLQMAKVEPVVPETDLDNYAGKSCLLIGRWINLGIHIAEMAALATSVCSRASVTREELVGLHTRVLSTISAITDYSMVQTSFKFPHETRLLMVVGCEHLAADGRDAGGEWAGIRGLLGSIGFTERQQTL